jgi:uncharacterized protein YneF (UPF0154 family)
VPFSLGQPACLLNFGHEITLVSLLWVLVCGIFLTITRIYRELKKLNSPKINEPIKKWTTELNRTFSKEEIQMAKNHVKKCSPSLAIKGMQIKTTLRFHLLE